MIPAPGCIVFKQDTGHPSHMLAADFKTVFMSHAVRCSLVVACSLNVPATGLCITGTDLLRQLYVLPY